ncbi:MAG: hypothetical protein ACXVJ3_20010 [Ilumatobacteraceae bacterium]
MVVFAKVFFGRQEGAVLQRGRRVGVSTRTRYASIGAIVAVLACGGGLLTASASAPPGASSFVPITPCRLFDTRPDTAVGARNTPLGAQATFTATVWGSNGHCQIPSGATGVSMNVVAVNPTAASFLTVFPADQPQPLASSLDWVARQPPTPNAVTVALSADGKVSFYNNDGNVDLAADVVGYYLAARDPGPRPAQVLWVAKSGGDYTTVAAALNAIGTTVPAADSTHHYVIKIAPGTYSEPGGIAVKNDVDLEGSGTDNTVITCACGGPNTPFSDGTTATMRIAGPTMTTQIRNLTVTNTGPGTYSTGIWNGGGTPFGLVSLLNVNITTSGGTGNYSLVNDASNISVHQAQITANGSTSGSETFSIANVGAAAGMVLQDVDAKAVGAGTSSRIGVYNTADLEVHDSQIIADNISISNVNVGSSPIAYVSNTELSPTVGGLSASFVCTSAYTGLFMALGAQCL